MIFGPDAESLFLTTFLIAGPAIAFCTKIYCNVNKGKDDSWGYVVMVVGSILTILVSKLMSVWLLAFQLVLICQMKAIKQKEHVKLS